MAATLSAYAVANAAHVSQSWAWKARDAGIIHAPYTEEDVIALQVYACVAPLVWPGERRVRSEKHGLELWQSLAVNAAREAMSDPHMCPETVLWVLQDAALLANTAGERAALELDQLAGRTAFRLPLGEWIAQVPKTLAQLPTSRPRKPRPPMSAA
ncbi:hypothetical protein [Streptacidiphilus rugosus]|uniref:hypothetical protein n=1 Tax=Streptacidiphilus rugosus TaxID=405783 RepID=UPI000569E9FC|nr:hypothetical protein [Streptacidiphilus rugosus]